jgi:hypothetical protein
MSRQEQLSPQETKIGHSPLQIRTVRSKLGQYQSQIIGALSDWQLGTAPDHGAQSPFRGSLREDRSPAASGITRIGALGSDQRIFARGGGMTADEGTRRDQGSNRRRRPSGTASPATGLLPHETNSSSRPDGEAMNDASPGPRGNGSALGRSVAGLM